MQIQATARRAAGARAACLVAALALLSACASTGNDTPATTDDGLEKVKSKRVDEAYKAPGADFSQYKRVNIADVEVSFRKNWLSDQNRDRRSLAHKLSQEDADRIKAAIASSFREIFTDELEAGGYAVLAEVDPSGDNGDLLLLLPAITDLDVEAPDTMASGRYTSYVTSAGSMTLGIEFRDSITGDVLGRVIDSRKAPDFGRLQIANSVTNKAEADRMLRRWAKMLVEALDRAHGK